MLIDIYYVLIYGIINIVKQLIKHEQRISKMVIGYAKRLWISRKQKRRVPRRETIKIIYQENLILTSAMGRG